MKFNLILSLIFCAIYSTNCLDTQLEQICIEDTFNYDGLEVNSYFHVQVPFEIPRLNELLINDSIKFDDWSSDENEVEEMYSRKTKYNNIVREFFNQDNINNFNVTELLEVKEKINNIKNYFESKEDQAIAEEYVELEYAIRRSYNNLGYLISLKKGRLNQEIVEGEFSLYIGSELLEILGKNGVLVFGDPLGDAIDEFLEKFYAANIARFQEVTFDPNDDDDDEDEEENEVNNFSIYVPVHKYKYNTREKCTNAIDLPAFYTKKN